MPPFTPTARLDCVKNLINAARANKFSTLRKLSADDQDVFDVWDHISQLVEYHMSRKKAMHISGLGTFTFTSSKLDVGHNKYILIQRPVFVLSEKLARTHGLTQSKYHVSGEIPVIQLNLIAIAHEMNIDRDLVEASVKEVVNALSRNIEKSRSCEFGFTTIGNLVITNGAVKMRFLPTFIEQMDQTGDLSKFLSKRSERCGSVLSDKSLVLPKIQSGERSKEPPPRVSNTYDIKEEDEDPIENKSPHDTPLLSSQGSLTSKKKEAITPFLKIEPKSPVIQQLVLTPPHSADSRAGTPKKPPNIKRNMAFRDPRNECDSKQSRMFPLVRQISKTKSLRQLMETPEKVSAGTNRDETACTNCAENMSDFCCLCYQREKHNVPIYFTEKRKKEEQDRGRLLKTYTLLEDNVLLQQERDLQAKKLEVAQSIAAFNLNVSELLKDKKEERSLDFNRSHLFRQRPITPLYHIKKEDYKTDLAMQVKVNRKRSNKAKHEKDVLERVEQRKLSEDLAAQRDQYLKNKRFQTNEYRRALDTQVYIKKYLEEGYFENHEDERTYALPRPNVVLPFQRRPRLSTNEPNMIAHRSYELPATYSGLDDPILGIYDSDGEKYRERRQCARQLYQNQLQMANQKREQQISLDKASQREEEEMLRRTKTELLQETLVRNQLRLQQRKDLEKTWALHVMKKKEKEFNEKFQGRSPGLLLQEQCDRYTRCVQCTRKPMNHGKSNVWAESRYVSGSRLMI